MSPQQTLYLKAADEARGAIEASVRDFNSLIDLGHALTASVFKQPSWTSGGSGLLPEKIVD
jgi:hypothetical protein